MTVWYKHKILLKFCLWGNPTTASKYRVPHHQKLPTSPCVGIQSGWLLLNLQPGVASRKQKCFNSHTFAQHFLSLSSLACVLWELLGLLPSTRYGMPNVREISLFSETLRKTFRNQICSCEWTSGATTEGEALTLLFEIGVSSKARIFPGYLLLLHVTSTCSSIVGSMKVMSWFS